MKAKEYFEKYDAKIVCGDTQDIYALLLEMSDEVKTLINSRHARQPSALAAVIREMNDKWNAICVLFEKKYKLSPLKRDGFKNFWLREIPELSPCFKPRSSRWPG